MKTSTIGDLFTEEELERMTEIIESAELGSDTAVSRITTEITEPALSRINKQLGQENDARYLAYMAVMAFSQARANQVLADDGPEVVSYKHYSMNSPGGRLGSRGHIYTWECTGTGGWHCAVEDTAGRGMTAQLNFPDEDSAIDAARSLIAQHVTNGVYTVVNGNPANSDDHHLPN